MSFSSSYSVPYANNNSDSRYLILSFPSFMLYGLVGGYEAIESAGQQATRQRMLKFKSHGFLYLVILDSFFPRAICGRCDRLLYQYVLRSLRLGRRVERHSLSGMAGHTKAVGKEDRSG